MIEIILGLIALPLMMVVALYIMIRFVENQRPKIRKEILDGLSRDKCLDIVVDVVPLKSNSTLPMMFMAGLLTIYGALMLRGAISGEPDIPFIMLGLLSTVAGVFLCYLAAPFKRQGQLIFSSKMMMLPMWRPRMFRMEPSIFRLEHVERVVVRMSGNLISNISFEGKVHGTLKLSKDDHEKYSTIIEYLKCANVQVENTG